jgi:peptidoglycan/xylan/chitin deacetylase (PgdA/CDA1 family)
MNATNKTRRDALKLLGAVPLAAMACRNRKTAGRIPHTVTLSFDDGFEKSSVETARIYEKYRLSASINVIAAAHQKDFALPNEYHRWPVGDFRLWNSLKAKGHEIMPHGWKHEDLAKCVFEEAKASITRCLDIFSGELNGFEPKMAVFNFPYNSSSPEVEEWLTTRVRAFRTSGNAVNPPPHRGQVRLTCVSSGPGNIDRELESTVSAFLKGPPGWLIFNTHGLDEEGWGPVSSSFLDELLDRLSHGPKVRILTVSQALDSVSSDKKGAAAGSS